MIIKDNMANMCAKVTSTYMEFTLAFGPKPEFSFSFKCYFSDELGALFFKKQAEQMFVFSLCIWYNKNMDKNMFNINNNEFSYGR